MKIKQLLLCLCILFGQMHWLGAKVEKYRNTNWIIDVESYRNLTLLNGSKGVVLAIDYHEDKKWRAAIFAQPFLVTNKEGVSNAILTFKAKKPFSIMDRSIKSYVDYFETDEGNLIFRYCNGSVVNWLVSKELIEVSIEEMGGTYKTFTFDTRGLKEVMLEAQKRQRAL